MGEVTAPAARIWVQGGKIMGFVAEMVLTLVAVPVLRRQ